MTYEDELGLPPPDQFDGNDLPVPFVSLMYGTSGAVNDGKAAVGDILAGGQHKLVLDGKPGFEALIFHRYKGKRKSIQGKTLCVGAKNQDGAWEGSAYGLCLNCAYLKSCNWKQYYFLRVLRGWPEENGEQPGILILGLEGAAGDPAARQLNQFSAMDGGYAFRSIIRFSVVKKARAGGGGVTYPAWAVEKVGETPKELQLEAANEARRLHEQGPLLLSAGPAAESTPFD